MECKSNGFTLIEVLVTISIISILSGMFVLNFPSMDKNFKVEKEVREAVEQIRKAREWALSLKQPPSGRVVGYGVNIDKNKNKIIIFSEDSTGNKRYNNLNEKVEEINFVQSKIDSITMLPANRQIMNADVFFLAPIPKVYINGSELGGLLEVKVVFKNKNGNQPKFELHINSAGLIYVQRI